MHALIDLTIELLERGEDECYSLSVRSLERVERELLRERGQGLIEAVRALVDFAHYLATELGSERAASSLIELAARAIPAIESFKTERSRTNARRFARFGGEKQTRSLTLPVDLRENARMIARAPRRA
jgi:hypothetical protein